MKKILVLLIVFAAILGLAYYKSNERSSRLNRSTTNVTVREDLFPDFDINGIKKIRVKEDKQETTLTVQNDSWVVSERGGYPVSKEKLQTVLMSLKYEKIKAGHRIGKDSWGKIGVNSPGDATAYGVGTLVELFDDKGTVKHSFVLGGQLNSSGGGNDQMKMFGGATGNRFIRLKDEDTIWEIGDQLTDLVTKPDAWVDKSFFDVQKIKSVEVTAPNPADSWKASRPSAETTDFVLEGAQPGEKIDSGKATLATLLSSPTFSDVQGKDKAAEIMKDAVKAKITTFDNFTYDVQVVKKKVGESDKYFLTMAVNASIPKERAPVKDEKPEDKKKNDETFASEKKTLEEKLANEKAYEGWVYEVTEYTVSTLLKKRSEILAEADKAPPVSPETGRMPGLPNVRNMIPGLPPQGSGPGTMPPGAPASAPTPAPAPTPPPSPKSDVPPALTNPPSPVPETPKVELKPAPAPDAAPVVPEKPGDEAKK